MILFMIGRNLTHNRLNTIDLIDIRNRDSYTVVTDFVPENFAPTPPQIVSSNKTAVIIASVFGTVGFWIIIVGAFILIRRKNANKNAIPTPGENDGRSTANYLPSTS